MAVYTVRRVDMVAYMYMYKRVKMVENWERWGVQKVSNEGFNWEKVFWIGTFNSCLR